MEVVAGARLGERTAGLQSRVITMGWSVTRFRRNTSSALEMMPLASDDRRRLRDAVIAYMAGTLRTHAFDDVNSVCMSSRDESVRAVAEWLYGIHDDVSDHPISVTEPVWNALVRIVAFLGTEASASARHTQELWPFASESEWEAARISVEGCGIPPYDPAIHARPVHGFLDRIPTPLAGRGQSRLHML